MPERFSPAQPNYLRFVSTPTIDIEPKYIRTNILDEEQAIDSLNFNRDLLARVSENMSTKITK